MEGFRTKAEQSGTAIKPVTRSSYETDKSGAYKTWHVIPHASTKRDVNKSGGYTSAYATRKDLKKKLKDKGIITTGKVHAVQTNKTTTLTLPTE